MPASRSVCSISGSRSLEADCAEQLIPAYLDPDENESSGRHGRSWYLVPWAGLPVPSGEVGEPALQRQFAAWPV